MPAAAKTAAVIRAARAGPVLVDRTLVVDQHRAVPALVVAEEHVAGRHPGRGKQELRRGCARACRSRRARCGRTATTCNTRCNRGTARPRRDRPGSRPAPRRATTRSHRQPGRARRSRRHRATRAIGAMIAVMSDAPWTGDACSLVDAFRAGDRSPVEELRGDARRDRGERPERVLVPRSGPRDGRGRAAPTCRRRSAACRSGVKELEPVAGWPATEASLVFRDRIATTTSPVMQAAAPRRAVSSPSGSRPRASSAAST